MINSLSDAIIRASLERTCQDETFVSKLKTSQDDY